MMNMKYLRVLNYTALVTLLFFLFLSTSEVANYFVATDEYRFGDAMVGKGGWKYLTKYHYLGALYGEIALSLIGLMGGFFLKNAKLLLLLRVTIIGILLLQIVVFQLSLD